MGLEVYFLCKQQFFIGFIIRNKHKQYFNLFFVYYVWVLIQYEQWATGFVKFIDLSFISARGYQNTG